MTGRELSDDVRDALSTLPAELATKVGRHLVMVGRLLEEDPEQAWVHAEAALERASRVGVVREVAGTAAYRSGRYDIALRELRAAKRLTGSVEVLPMLADAERGLGRPHKAIDLAASDEAAKLDTAGRLELLIVAAGAHLDLDDPAAARSVLDIAELDVSPKSGSAAARVARARLFSAYADALAADGQAEEAAAWRARAAEADVDGSITVDDPPEWDDFTVLDLDPGDEQPQDDR